MRSKGSPRNARGGALVPSLIVVVVLVIGAAAYLSHTSTEVVQVRENIASIRAFYYAEAGLNYAQAQLLRGWQLASLINPFQFIDSMTSLPADMVLEEGTSEQGRFQVEITNVSTPYTDARDVTVRARGTYREQNRTAVATFCLELKPSRVFDYGYFVNHCGWLEGMPPTFTVQGNLRANGLFSFFNSSLYAEGNPESRWERGQTEYKDSGGIYSGFRIVDALSVEGMGSLPLNQHMNEDLNDNRVLDPGEDHNQNQKLTLPEQVAMPNLTETGLYEEYAMSWNGGAGSSIKIEAAGQGGTDLLVSNAIYGDEDGEKGNLMLWGTEQNPIIIDGPVVVRGALIIKGYVKGKGSLYVKHNIYIPDNVIQVNPPVGRPNWNYFDYSTPEERYQGWTEALSQWRGENADKDAVGLFAAENVVIGDFQETSWRSDVDTWLNHPANESAEAANGLDRIPETDDPGENDQIWTVDRYTEADLNRGLMPPGKSVGEVIPGSGEDIDGDAVEDQRIALSDFDLPAPFDTISWGGWTPLDAGSGGDGPGKSGGKGGGRGKGGGGKGGGRPGPPGSGSGPTSYSDFFNEKGGDALDHIDALIYTNHAIAANWGRYSSLVHLFGGLLCRIEAIIFRNDGTAEWIHDERFTGGGEELNLVLPRVKKPIQIIHWAEVPAGYAPGSG